MSILPVSDDLSVSLQSFVGRFLWRKLDEGLSRVSSYVISDDGDPILHDVQTWKTQTDSEFGEYECFWWTEILTAPLQVEKILLQP